MKVFYRLDYRRATYREFSISSFPLIGIPYVTLVKLFRLPIVASTDDPPVETLSPFEVQEADLPAEVRERFAPLTGELSALGFGQPIFHAIPCTLQHTQIVWATFAHPTGRAAARIHHRVWSQPGVHKSYLFPVFVSEMSDGSFLVSSAGKRDMAAPKSVEDHYDTGVTAAELWQNHQRRLDDRLPAGPVDVRSQDRVRDMIERHHAALRDFHVGRGVFQPVRPEEQEKLVKQAETVPVTAGTSVDDAVLALLERQRAQRPSLGNFFAVLVISLLAFLAAGFKDMDRRFLYLLVPILLFHELGHYVSMRCFGYRNLRMFFIPFFGAAVSGKHYNVAGWKKAVVALAGPVPGIFAGAALGIAGLVSKQPTLTEAAMLALILNVLNLLPFLPLDGGWVAHAVLFCRHPLLDLAFRLVAILAFLGVGILTGGAFKWLALFLLLSLPAAWHVSRVAQRLRQRGPLPASPDGVSIPPDAARAILVELGAGKHARGSASVLAQQVTGIYETLNARPPGPAASAGLLVAQGGSFAVALVFLVVLMLFRHGLPFRNLPAPRDERPPYSYVPGGAEQWAAKGTAVLNAAPKAGAAPGRITVVAAFADEAAARAAFAAAPAFDAEAAPGHGAAVSRFGQSVLVTLPEGAEAARDRWKDRLGRTAKEVAVADKSGILMFRFSCNLPSEQDAARLAEELAAYLHGLPPELLLPPWSPAWNALPAKQRAELERARRTLGRLATVDRRALEEPEVKAIGVDQFGQLGAKDVQKLREMIERRMKAVRAARERLLAEIAADKDGADQAVVETWRRLNKLQKREGSAAADPDPVARERKALAFVEQRDALQRELARRVGSPAAATPEARANLEGVSFGGFHAHGREMSVVGLQFRCPAVGVPAFGEWLARQGAGDVRYGFQSAPTGPGPGEEDDPD